MAGDLESLAFTLEHDVGRHEFGKPRGHEVAHVEGVVLHDGEEADFCLGEVHRQLLAVLRQDGHALAQQLDLSLVLDLE